MSDSSLKCLLCTVAFILAFELLGIRTDAASGEGPILADGHDLYYKTFRILPILSAPQSIVNSPVIKISHKDHDAIPRKKRNVLFPSGVKLCAEESVQQSIANHLSYFHLRVCQETVWEAFKIFWDRLPNQEEYQTWMSQCLNGTATALAMGNNFSQSKEHLALIESRMLLTGLNSEPTNSWLHMCSTPTPATEQEALGEVISEFTIEGTEVELPTEPTNDIEVLALPTRAQLEQVVELSILLKGERYSDALRDPASLQYQTLNQQFTDKIEDALEGLPGLKSVAVLEFRLDGVVVVYAVTVEVEGEWVSSEQLDYLTLQSNLVENSYREVEERPTVVYTITDFRNYITEALQNDNIISDTTLAQVESVSIVPESFEPTAGITKDDSVEILAAEMTLDAPEVKAEDVATGENDVIILEESVTLPPEPEVTIDDTGMEEEGLLLGNTVATESPPLEHLPADPTSPEQPEGTTLPEPPLEIEASGSGVDGLEVLSFQPEEEEAVEEEPAPAADEELTVDEEVILEEVIIEEEILTEEAEAEVPEEEEAVEVPEEEEAVEIPEEEEAAEVPEEEEAVVVPEEEEVEEEAEAEVPEKEKVEEEAEAEVPEKEKVEEEAVEVPEDEEVEEIPEEEEAAEVPEEEEAVVVPEEEEVEEEAEAEVPEKEKVEEEAVEVPEEEEAAEVPEEEEAVEVPEEEEVEEEAEAEVPEKEKVEEEAVEVPEEEEAAEVPEEEEAVEVPEEEEVEEETEAEVPEKEKVEEEAVEVPEEEEVEEEAVEVPDTAEVLEEEAEPSENLEYSIIETETIEELEEEAPAFVPVETTEAPEPVENLNVPENPPAIETVPPDEPEEEANEVFAYPEITEYGEEVKSVEEGPIIEQPVTGEDALEVAEEEVVMEPPDITEISEEDLVEDEMLLVDEAVPEAAHPTPLSAEKELPFTRVSDAIVVEEATEATALDTAPEPEAKSGNQGVTPALRPAKYYPGPDISITLELQTIDPVTDYDQTEEGSSGHPSGGVHGMDHSVAMPINPGRALMVFFSLRVTNMKFSDDLFNKSSPEYKALEQRFIELLVPYLQSNLSNFQNLEILNFRKGSIVVNSRMKFGKPVPRGVNTAVYLILEDFANTAYQTMNLAIDKYSLDVESGDQANQCKFQACNEFAQCSVNRWSGEAECVCNAGYFSVDGLPCQSICDLQTDFCLNDGKCDIIPGQGAICRCRVGENWWYRGEHCEEYVSEPLVVGIAIASVAGFLLVASGVIFFLARTLRDQYDKDETEDPIRRGESIPSLERATKYNPMYESEATMGYSHYYRRYPEAPVYSSTSAEASTDFSSEEIRHIYENSELTKEEIQDRIRIIELYAKDRQFADFVRQHQTALDTRSESALDTCREIALDTCREIALDTCREIALDTCREIALDTCREIALDTCREIALDTCRESTLDTRREIALDTCRESTLDTCRESVST
ncbi:interphotoreceptor matrix proteoglycan 2-like [Coregonus clupeaformis]|uniref:interphotoreceptor matrix proteoglycan 2-like n=1 Tax=Coregonus clupeaformis TaxID=59861 RepID=UPI001E1C3395|nr:interphotoreceptor matrix proteoglycan 2-like [Coregonus clupeaformis]